MKRKFQSLAVVLAGGACMLLLAADSQAKSVDYPYVSVKGSKGYSISVHKAEGGVGLSASGKKGGASYSVKGTATKKKLKANFKGFGKVDLEFEPKGKAKTQKPPKGCTGPSSKSQEGLWVGTIKFTGEGGYTKVNGSVRAKGSVNTSSDKPLECKPEPNPKPKPPKPCWGVSGNKGKTWFSASQTKGEKASFYANTSSTSKGVKISRYTSGSGGTLAVEGGGETATLKPPAPFSGSGTLADGVLSGTLKVKFPGATTKLTGFKASAWETTCS